MEKNLKDRASRKRTRIVATIGPKSESKDILRQLVDAGMNVARLNFSHGDFAEHGAKVKNVQAVAKEAGRPVAILQDLAGPEIRLGTFSKERSDDRATIVEGEEFILTIRDIEQCDNTITTVDYAELPKQVKEGEMLILDDGKRVLRVKSSTDTDIITEVIVGGEITGRRCLFAPDSTLTMSALTQKDKEDLEFIKEHEVDFVAISFVRDGSDIEELRALLKEMGKQHIKIVAKIETKTALENLEEILKATDAVMVARGDLGVELPATEVPLVQKRIIKMANDFGKPVITATQMLLSMVERPAPTRAEVSDASNAILDGTDALMLSEESALGKYPVEAVKMLASIAESIDKQAYIGEISKQMKEYLKQGVHDTDDIVSTSVAQMAKRVGAKAIVALTESGGTARLISRFKSEAPIIAITPSEVTYRQLALSANCYPVMIDRFKYIGEVIDTINDIVKSNGLATSGDRIIISAGVPFGVVGGTNLAMVHTVN